MSVLRFSQPGEPTLLVDLGPGIGRSQHTRGAITGGMLVVAESERARHTRLQRESLARQRSLAVEPERPVRQVALCRKWMILPRTECARRSRHVGDCATRAAMDAENRAARKRLGGS